MYLETDPVSGENDKYGRALAYIWTTGGVLINQAQISGGYGREYTYQHQRYKYREMFLADQATAKTQRDGLWGKC
ncbi:thermonuclease family protein [Kocuria massiliensis]|uniref:thermonuclease family protein n=1 Tax=Kocuria massiliensis TaxID=1926282 RepID=UPI003B3A9DD5